MFFITNGEKFKFSRILNLKILVDCEWDRFGPWTECSTSCGEGFQRRIRTVKQRQRNGGEPCRGSDTQSRNCNKGPCSGRLIRILNLKKN